MIDLVRRVLDAMQSDLEPVVLNEASNEIRLQFLSAAHARRTLPWSPLFTLDEGMRRTVAWYQDFLRASYRRIDRPQPACATCPGA